MIGEAFVSNFRRACSSECFIGSRLLEYAMKEHGADHLWALEKNVKAIRFYERHGFSVTGEKKLEDGTSEYLVLLRKNGSGWRQSGDR